MEMLNQNNIDELKSQIDAEKAAQQVASTSKPTARQLHFACSSNRVKNCGGGDGKLCRNCGYAYGLKSNEKLGGIQNV
jgi:hypothetical protein